MIVDARGGWVARVGSVTEVNRGGGVGRWGVAHTRI